MLAAAIILILIALLLGGLGLAVWTAKWVLIVALIILLIGVLTGAAHRRRL